MALRVAPVGARAVGELHQTADDAQGELLRALVVHLVGGPAAKLWLPVGYSKDVDESRTRTLTASLMSTVHEEVQRIHESEDRQCCQQRTCKAFLDQALDYEVLLDDLAVG